MMKRTASLLRLSISRAMNSGLPALPVIVAFLAGAMNASMAGERESLTGASRASQSEPALLAASYSNGDVCVFDWKSKRAVWEREGNHSLAGNSGVYLCLDTEGDLIFSHFITGSVNHLETAGPGGRFTPLMNERIAGGAGAVALGPDGCLYVCGRQEDRVIRIGECAGEVEWLPEEGILADAPMDLAFGRDGRLYVASGHGDKVVRMIPAPGAAPETFVQCGAGGLRKISAIAFGPDDDLLVCCREGDIVRRFDGESGAFIGPVVREDAELFGPFDLAIGADGDLFVAFQAPQAVVRYDAASGAEKGRLSLRIPGRLDCGSPESIAFLPGAEARAQTPWRIAAEPIGPPAGDAPPSPLPARLVAQFLR